MAHRIILLSLIVLVLSSATVWDVRANEYFGDGTMVTIGNIGIIDAWGWYLVILNNCKIMPLSSPVGDAVIVQCGMRYNDKQNRFSGWYDFRGHPRPFCGAIKDKGLPEKCLGE